MVYEDISNTWNTIVIILNELRTWYLSEVKGQLVSRSTAFDLYYGEAWFLSQHGHLLSCLKLRCVYSVVPREYRDLTSKVTAIISFRRSTVVILMEAEKSERPAVSQNETLTLNPLTWKIWWAPNNASRWDLTRRLKRLRLHKVCKYNRWDLTRRLPCYNYIKYVSTRDLLERCWPLLNVACRYVVIFNVTTL